MPRFCRGEQIHSIQPVGGQDDPRGPPIFEWPVGEEVAKKPDIKKHKKKAPKVPQYKGSVWHSMASKLPVGQDDDAVALRQSLWQRSDGNGNGLLALTEINTGLRAILSQEEMVAARPAIASAFAFAKDYNRSAKARPREFVQVGEYRVFLVALKARLEYSHAFQSMDADRKRDERR
jgi:hypothetical protein